MANTRQSIAPTRDEEGQEVMSIMLEKLYDALRAGNVPDDKARDAAVEGAQYENRAVKIEGDLTLLKWMVGSNVGITLVVLAFVLRGHP
jgi:hypothetical protein